MSETVSMRYISNDYMLMPLAIATGKVDVTRRYAEDEPDNDSGCLSDEELRAISFQHER